ncbi:hypothetical protein JTE90_001204 [Oedothorax gibbosus]|uniref:Uncharacterized protein n=1 Tax=Oedothorax gibbosus TaxID=931172 RepID=A0AAV6UTL6_9ARAC|nr:hypothetical protein JTE90_001204 [Oedothorax gibbosus]
MFTVSEHKSGNPKKSVSGQIAFVAPSTNPKQVVYLSLRIFVRNTDSNGTKESSEPVAGPLTTPDPSQVGRTDQMNKMKRTTKNFLAKNIFRPPSPYARFFCVSTVVLKVTSPSVKKFVIIAIVFKFY